MIPAKFEYVRPTSLDEALGILRDREGDAKILSGGYSLLPLLKLRLAQPALLVDIAGLSGLDEIIRTEADWRIGARATHRRILEHAALTAEWQIFRDAAAVIGDPQVKNWGTIGGSCAHADPGADWPAVMLALRADFLLRRASGERWHPARGFFHDTYVTAIEPTEMLIEVRVPHAPPRTGSAYVKLERRAGDFSTVGVAAVITLGGDGRVASAGIGLTAVADAPFAASRHSIERGLVSLGGAEEVLHGAHPTAEMLREAASAATEQSRPVSDSHGPAEYKLAMVREITTRALTLAVSRAQGA
jgi:carbon-monoxide dehydrogenase medium subunit